MSLKHKLIDFPEVYKIKVISETKDIRLWDDINRKFIPHSDVQGTAKL